MISFAKKLLRRERETTPNRPLSQKIVGGIRNFRTTLNRPCHRDDTKVCAYTKIFYFFPSRAQFGAEQIALVSFFLLSSTRTSGAHRYELLGRKGGYSGRATAAGVCHSLGRDAISLSWYLFSLSSWGQKTKNVFLWWKPELSHFLKGSKRQFVFFQSD